MRCQSLIVTETRLSTDSYADQETLSHIFDFSISLFLKKKKNTFKGFFETLFSTLHKIETRT